jgi:hypothetical protein
MRPAGSAVELERRRKRASDLLATGHGPVEVARTLGVDRRRVRRWNAAYHELEEAGIVSRPASGRRPKLDAKQRARRGMLLLKEARAAGFSTDLWTCAGGAPTKSDAPSARPAVRLEDDLDGTARAPPYQRLKCLAPALERESVRDQRRYVETALGKL